MIEQRHFDHFKAKGWTVIEGVFSRDKASRIAALAEAVGMARIDEGELSPQDAEPETAMFVTASGPLNVLNAPLGFSIARAIRIVVTCSRPSLPEFRTAR